MAPFRDRRASTRSCANIRPRTGRNFQSARRPERRKFLRPHDTFRFADSMFHEAKLCLAALSWTPTKQQAAPDRSHLLPLTLLRNRLQKFSSRDAKWARFLKVDNFRYRQISRSPMPRRAGVAANRIGQHHRDDRERTRRLMARIPPGQSAKLVPPAMNRTVVQIPSPKGTPNDPRHAFEKVAVRFVEGIDLRAFDINHAQNAIVFVVDNGDDDFRFC